MNLYTKLSSILALLLFCGPLHAGLSIRHSVELSPQYRRLNQTGFSRLEEVWDVFGLLNSHVEYSAENWFAEIKPEIRSVVSRGVMDSAPAGVSARTSKRLFNFRHTLVYNEDGEAYFDLDRFDVRYSFNSGEVFAGRKPLSLGVLRFFPVWNKLTLPLIFQPGPEWIENPDVAGASYQSGKLSLRAFASRGEQAVVDDLALVEARWAGSGYEWQFLGGLWWEHAAAGLAGSFDVLESSLRLEALWISRLREDPSQVQLGMGFERALSSKWTLVAETLFQTAGLADTRNTLAPPNRFTVLSGRFYVLPNLSYQLHPLWTVRAGALIGASSRPSYVALGGFEHSVSDDTVLTLKIKWPFGQKDGEFGPERISDRFGRTLGMSSTLLLQLQSTF